MAICSPCAKLKPVISKSDLILIGVADINTDYVVKFTRLTDNMILKYLATSDGDGKIYVDFAPEFSGLPYQINIYEEDAPGVDVEFTIGDSAVTATCVNFNGEMGCVESQTLIPA